MSQIYLSKSITSPSTGVTTSAWCINGWRTRNNTDPTKITFSVSIVGYITPAALTSGLTFVPGSQYNYRLTSANFPNGKDLTSVSLTDLYNAVLEYVTTTTTDPLNGATLVSS